MNYFYQKNNNDTLIVLFHGTGGNEYQLLQLMGDVYHNADILSFEGNFGEGISRRFFPPLVNGQLNRERYNEAVQSFMSIWDTLKLQYRHIVLIGYSNGANFIIGLLEQGIKVDEAILMHPSNLGYEISNASSAIRIILTAGANDYIAPAGQVKQLEQQFATKFKDVKFILLDGGHELDEQEAITIKSYVN